MDCSTFRRLHLAYLDDTLCADLLVAAECHVIECAACARHDTAVRRALMLARNLPSIEPSPDFTARLQTRLGEIERGERAAPPAPPMDWAPTWRELAMARVQGGRLPSRRTMAVAASLLAVVSAGALSDWERPAGGVAVAGVAAVPALATQGASGASGVSGSAGAPDDALAEPAPGEPRFVRFEGVPANALVIPASAGVPVWPAALMAGEAQVQMMGVASGVHDLQLVGLTR